MTNTDKILAEFDERMVRLNKAKITRHISDRHIFQWNDKETPSHGDQYEDSEYGYLDEMLRTLFSDSIHQAIAEDRERLLGEIEKVKFTIYDGDIKREVVGLEDLTSTLTSSPL